MQYVKSINMKEEVTLRGHVKSPSFCFHLAQLINNLLLLLAICLGSLAPSSRSLATHEDLLLSIFPAVVRKVTFMDHNNHLFHSGLSFLLHQPRQTCLNLLALSHEAAELVQKCLGIRA